MPTHFTRKSRVCLCEPSRLCNFSRSQQGGNCFPPSRLNHLVHFDLTFDNIERLLPGVAATHALSSPLNHSIKSTIHGLPFTNAQGMAFGGNSNVGLGSGQVGRNRRNSDTALVYNPQTSSMSITALELSSESMGSRGVALEGQPVLSSTEPLEPLLPLHQAAGASNEIQQSQREFRLVGEIQLPSWQPPQQRRPTRLRRRCTFESWNGIHMNRQMMSSLCFANYFVMLYSSIATIVAGKAAESRASWDMVFLLYEPIPRT